MVISVEIEDFVVRKTLVERVVRWTSYTRALSKSREFQKGKSNSTQSRSWAFEESE